ncbi:hypothetical protein B6D29_00690 [Microgenomates bacterium UTCPR1]|nr:MAG: hypothetical protein B6D29_00690 [Microgenomates bacterium UTCPR1]
MFDFRHYLKRIGEYGEVVGVKDTVVLVEGLPTAKLNEVVLFEQGVVGQVATINEDNCQIVVLDKLLPDVGEKVVRTDDFLSVPIGEDLLGKMIDPLGRVIYPQGKISGGDKVVLNRENSQVIWDRKKITESLLTGVTLVDMLMPIGKGQKELVIGERKTGKTAFLLTTVKNQIKSNGIIIFCVIGKKKTDVKNLLNYFQEQKIMDKIVFISTLSDDSPSLIHLAPFTAMAIAEYYKDRGLDSLVILDDLSTHARYYRELSLLNNKFPGRESYPGDIFYLHASLLERAGNFRKPDNANLKFEISNLKLKQKDTVSITCLPVAEVIEGDFTGHITTNLMGITDGHIFFDRSIFAKGRRPAINLMLSVTRVGRQTQSKLLQEINNKITAFLSDYESVKNLTHFGAELSPEVKDSIERGRRLERVLEQRYDEVIDLKSQILLLTVAFGKEFFQWDVDEVRLKIFKEELDDSILEVNSFSELKNKVLEYINNKFAKAKR